MLDSIRFFKQETKELQKQFNAGEDHALARVKAVLNDSKDIGLQKFQHVVAVEADFDNWSDLIGANEVERQLVLVMKLHPLLCYNGMYSAKRLRKENDEWQFERHGLRLNTEMISLVVDWLNKNIAPRKTINRRAGSYSMKHRAEIAIGHYIPNGFLIAAALICGYPHRFDIPSESPNAWFGMSNKDIKKFPVFQEFGKEGVVESA